MKTGDNLKQYRLQSSPIVHVEGMMRNIKTMHNTGDEALGRQFLSAWTDDPKVYDKIVAGDYEVDGEDVLVTVERSSPRLEREESSMLEEARK